MAYAVGAEPFHDPSVTAPVLRPRDHVMVGGIVYAAVFEDALGRRVSEQDRPVVQSDHVAIHRRLHSTQPLHGNLAPAHRVRTRSPAVLPPLRRISVALYPV